MADHNRQEEHNSMETGSGGNFPWGRIAFIAGSVIVIGFGLYRVTKPMLLSLAQHIVNNQKKAQETGEDFNKVAVEAEKVTCITMPKHVNTIGELKANKSVIIHSEINGLIKEILFKEGTEVKKGDLLIKFEDEQVQARVKSAKARFKAANAEFERYEKMRKAGAGSGREYDKAKGEMNTAKGELGVAEAEVKKTEIRAPFDGVIGLIDINEGAYVDIRQDLVTLVDLTPMKVKFGIPGKFVNEVGVGQTIQMKVDACRGRLFRGIVEAVDSHVDPSTNTVSLRASVPNDDGALKSGLFASVSLIIGEQSETITVDEAAVDRMGEQEFVWIVDRGRARRVPILTGAREHGRIEVIAGLKEGQTVVTAGQLRLTEGRWVKITNMESQDPALVTKGAQLEKEATQSETKPQPEKEKSASEAKTSEAQANK